MANKLFIVDDDILTCNLLETIAKPLFNTVEVFQDSRLFVEEKIDSSDVILLDLMMPEIDA